MGIIPRLIGRYAVLLYALCTLGALLYFWAAIRARRKQGQALFGIERDAAANQSLRSWLMVGVCVLLFFGVYSTSAFIVPNLPAEQSEETPLISLLFTPTANPTFLPPPTSAPLPTVTFAPISTVAPIATPLNRVPNTPVHTPTMEGDPVPPAPACNSAGIQIISPSNGERLSGVVEVIGTANLPDFSFYKFEIRWPNSDEWVTLHSFDSPVAGGFLGNWDTRPLADQPGTYGFRLVVVDDTGNYPEPCVINVVIG